MKVFEIEFHYFAENDWPEIDQEVLVLFDNLSAYPFSLDKDGYIDTWKRILFNDPTTGPAIGWFEVPKGV